MERQFGFRGWFAAEKFSIYQARRGGERMRLNLGWADGLAFIRACKTGRQKAASK